jgi:hypothetical protein
MSPGAEQARAERFAHIWSVLDAALDWERLGVLHCHEGGESFFGVEDRGAILDAGLLFADDLAALLTPSGRSLYVGASVAELVPMLVESQILGRDVLWYEKETPVTTALTQALAQVAKELDCQVPLPKIEDLPESSDPTCDHLWMVSVLTDPDVFPALHDRLYERTGELATGRGDPATELAVAEELTTRALAFAKTPAIFSTTDEELRIVRPLCQRLGFDLRVPESARLSAVVGDPVRLCELVSHS